MAKHASTFWMIPFVKAWESMCWWKYWYSSSKCKTPFFFSYESACAGGSVPVLPPAHTLSYLNQSARHCSSLALCSASPHKLQRADCHSLWERKKTGPKFLPPGHTLYFFKVNKNWSLQLVLYTGLNVKVFWILELLPLFNFANYLLGMIKRPTAAG